MWTQDHMAYARRMTAGIRLERWKKAAFHFGCIFPDYNCFSYLGHKIEHFSNGHSYEARKKEIIQLLNGPYDPTILWWYRCGLIFHYLGDSFSRPHNAAFGYDSLSHVRYETRQHDLIKRSLRRSTWRIPAIEGEINDWLEKRHAAYMNTTKGIQDDCYYIYTTLFAVWDWLVKKNQL